MFRFLKYVNPLDYWNSFTLPDGSKVNPNIYDSRLLESGDLDSCYKNKSAAEADRVWLNAISGPLLFNQLYFQLSELPEIKDIHDNYVFIRKYYSKKWAYYVFLLRLIHSGKILREIRSFYNTRQIKKLKIDNHCKDVDTSSRNTHFDTSQRVAVIIPTLNRYPSLGDALIDLTKQTYTNFEVIIVDQSDDFNNDFYDDFDLDITVIRQEEKLLWTARNRAIQKSNCKFLLFFDDDSRVDKDWIENHMLVLLNDVGDISCGITKDNLSQRAKPSYSIAKQLDTGNVLIDRNVFDKIGTFDTAFEKQRMGDGEFGLRAFRSGFRLVRNNQAPRIHLKLPSGGLREMGLWDEFRSVGILKPLPVPSVLYFCRKYFNRSSFLILILHSIIKSSIPYSKKYRHSNSLFYVSLLVRWPFLIIRVIRSMVVANNLYKVFR